MAEVAVNIMVKWLDVARAQRKREAKAIEEKYGATVAQPIYAEVELIDKVTTAFRSETTPLEEYIKKKAAR